MKDLKKELQRLENNLFMLEMADRWEQEDYRIAQELRDGIKIIKERIKNENI